MDVDRRVRLRLRHVDELLARELEQREERHDEVNHVGVLGEQRRELGVAARREHLEDAAHLGAHRQLLARDEVVAVDLRALHEAGPGGAQVARLDVREPRGGDPIEPHAHQREVALRVRQRVDRLRRRLHALVLEQPADELGARVGGLVPRGRGRPRQQQPRLDLDQHGGHQQVLGRELELRSAHHLDVAQVLSRQLRHRDVEHVDVLLADQVDQEVERPLEGLEEHLERLGRDVEIDRQLRERFPVDARDRLGRR
jgi:hypothetical protein